MVPYEATQGDPKALERRRVIARFIRQYRRVEKARKLVPSKPLNFKLDFDEGKLGTKLTVDESVHRLVNLLRPFLRKGSELELRGVFEALRGERQEAFAPQEVRDFESAMSALEHGEIELRCDGKLVTQREAYDYVSDGTYFDERPEAAEFLKTHAVGPTRGTLWFEFYSFSIGALRIASWLYGCALEPRPTWEPRSEVVGDCIYCRRTDGGFSSEEHVLPESLGGDGDVLKRGVVCDRCNNRVLSILDETLISFGPIAAMRVFNVPFTKEGKMPRAKLGQVSLEKRFPRVIRIEHGANKDVFAGARPLPNGMIGFQIQGREKANWRELARAFFKIALNMVAFHKGRERACEPEFDAARRFILEDADFQGYFFMASSGIPSGDVQATLTENSGLMLVEFDFFGVRCGVHLQEKPLMVDAMEIAKEAAEKGMGMIPLFGKPLPLVEVTPKKSA